MIEFKAIIKKFNEKGDKTSWTYIEIPHAIAEQLNPGIKKSYRVKGKLDTYAIDGISLLPFGEGNFIMALNAQIRKAIKKEKGDKLNIQLEVDRKEKKLSADFIECLMDVKPAYDFFNSLPKSHQRYYSNWIESAKTSITKEKRIIKAIKGLSMKLSFGEMTKLDKE